MSRVDQLKHEEITSDISPEDWAKWLVSFIPAAPITLLICFRHSAFDGLLGNLGGHILSLFPSSRIIPTGHAPTSSNLDIADQIVWQLLAAFAAIGSQQQQMAVVTEVKDLILQIVQNVHSGLIVNAHEASLKLANVNILLRAIGLDDRQLLAS